MELSYLQHQPVLIIGNEYLSTVNKSGSNPLMETSIYKEHLLDARFCSRYWRDSSEQNRHAFYGT